MFERFTEGARQVVVIAQEEARTLKHNHVGTEHILLGLLREEEGVAARALESLDITVERVRAQVVRNVDPGEEVTSGSIPFTPRAKKALELSARESLGLGETFIYTEHLLLGLTGLMRQDEGLAVQILDELGADREKIRAALKKAASLRPAKSRRSRHRIPASVSKPVALSDTAFSMGFAPPVRRLLMSASARALDDGRLTLEIRDILLALTQREDTAPLMAELGLDESTVRSALQRHGVGEGGRTPASES